MYRSRRNRIALGCSLAACVTMLAAGVVSAFWYMTYAGQSWGVRLEGGDVVAARIPNMLGYGLPLGSGLTIDRASHPGVTFGLPGVENVGSGSYFAIMPLWLPLAVFVWLSLRLWRSGLRVPPGHCPCGYSLTGNQSGVCPECGAKTTDSGRHLGGSNETNYQKASGSRAGKSPHPP